MQTPLALTFYAVFLTQSITELLAQLTETNRTKEHFDKSLGPLLIHVNTTKLPPESHPVRWDDKHATEQTTTFLNFVKNLPELNPFRAKSFRPYDTSLLELHFEKENFTFENITITGIKDINSQNVNMQLSPTRIDFNASVPSIIIEADYDLETIIDNNFPIRDRGHFKVSLLDMFVSASIGLNSVEFPTGNVYQLETADIEIDLNDVQLEMDTMYAEEIQIILDVFFKYAEAFIVDNDILNFILKAINQELAEIPAKKIVNYLLGTSVPNLSKFGPNGDRRSGRKYGK